MQLACLGSFVAHGHDFELFTYDSMEVPDGIRLADANAIIPLDEVFYFDNPQSGGRDLGPFSDLFRFKLLLERGGWWVDVDTVCVSGHIPHWPRAWAAEAPKHVPDAIGPGQIAFAAGDPVVKILYDRCLALSRKGFKRREMLGPKLLSRVIAEQGLPRNMNGSTETFFPVPWIEAFKLWMPEFRGEMEERAGGAFFMPVFQSLPQYLGLAMDKSPPAGSYLGELCSRFGQAREPHLEAAPVRSAVRDYLVRNDWALTELATYANPETFSILDLPAPLPLAR